MFQSTVGSNGRNLRTRNRKQFITTIQYYTCESNWEQLLVLTVKGTLRNYDGDGNGNAKKSNGSNALNSNSARASRFFCAFLCRPRTNTTWNDQMLSLLELRERPGDKFYHFCLNSSLVDSLLLSNRTTWDNRKISLKGYKVYFFANVAVFES